ncbi:MAG: carbohydrate kinase [Haliea sp.]|nr:carbohydrate kinase [Haliea sp.]
MHNRAVVVLDTGKTVAKLSLWDATGCVIARRSRANERIDAGDYTALDALGIADWLAETLRDFAALADVGAIIPVSHGAAAAIVGDGHLRCPPLDYEQAIPAAIRADYNRQRDAFSATGSPALPAGLNLGLQLYWLQHLHPQLLDGDAIIMPWAQYWSWLLCGVAASEITSLGCHTDLWQPLANAPSRLAVAHGWAQRLAPLRRAGDLLGTLTPHWVAQTGLPADVQVYCGLHDSNAALYAARGFPEIAQREATVVSTGTWFVAMRSLPERAAQDIARDIAQDIAALDERRDCLLNIDVNGRAVPSARFMGGREIEVLTGVDTRQVDIAPDQSRLLAAVAAVVQSGAKVLPTFAPDVGPFPRAQGRWLHMPKDESQQRAAVCLYIACVLNEVVQLLGTRERVLIEGRFARAEVLVRALATLRPDLEVYIARYDSDVSYGALRLIHPHIVPPEGLLRVAPLDVDLEHFRNYCNRWQRAVQTAIESSREGL